MLLDEVKQILKDKYWTVYVKTSETTGAVIAMGKYASELSVKFEMDGRVTIPSSMEIYPPEIDHWDVSEERKEIVLYGVDGTVSDY